MGRGGTLAATPQRDSTRVRLSWLDGLRGLAIVLMIFDHVAAVYGSPWWVRDIITRPALPLFMLTAGFLWRPGLRWRHVELLAAAAVSVPLAWGLGLAFVPVLVVYVLVLPVLDYSARWPVLAGSLAVLQVSAWPLNWWGYEPGVVLGLLILGQIARQTDAAELQRLGRHLTAFAGIGRWPLSVYVGHLAVLAVVTGLELWR